jgi:exopolysaccharide biosynthesis polyprenyl glycosylphosphotransferase
VCSFGSVLALVFPLTSRAGTFHPGTLALAWALSTVLMILIRVMLGSLVGSSAPGRKQVLIVGTGARALELYREMSKKAEADYQLLGFVDSRGARPSSPEIQERILGELSQLETLLVNHIVDEVLITLPVKSCYTQIQHTIHTCERVGVESKYLNEIFKPSLSRARHEQLEGFPMTSMKLVQDDGRLLIKRAIDIAGATIGLLALSPLMLLIAAAIRLTSQGPVIFGQERYGRNKRRFRMYKFRTMVCNAEALQEDLECRNEVAGPAFKIKDDPRVTRVGRFLRRTSLDELPQLFNVLRGEMSLVGPRPLPQRDVSRFEEGWLMRRFCVVPGLTGLWQINGRSNTSFDKWVEHDLSYIDRWSLMLDLKIMAQTIPAVVKGVGAV